jgi:hypothetical protein
MALANLDVAAGYRVARDSALGYGVRARRARDDAQTRSGAGGRRYDRESDVSGSEALGAECWELMSTLVERLYDPDEQVGW